LSPRPRRAWFDAEDPFGLDEELTAPWAQADGAHESVDLPVALAVDDPSGLSLGRASGSAGETTMAVSVFDGLDVPEIACKSVEL
jgi:hypothetical protein